MRPIRCTVCGTEDEVEDKKFVLGDPPRALERRAVVELAKAIQSTGSSDATMALDVLFRDEPTIQHWIGVARASIS